MHRPVRAFVFTSMVAVFAAGYLIITCAQWSMDSQLFAVSEQANVSLAEAFRNSLWPDLGPIVAAVGETGTHWPAERPEIERTRRHVVEQLAGTQIAKVKVYDLNGLTVFSTETEQIGQDQSSNAAVQAALIGDVTSQLGHRESFNAYDGEIFERDVFASYIPVYAAAGRGEIVAVFELYADVTAEVARSAQVMSRVRLVLVATLSILFALLVGIVLRSDQIAQQRFDELGRVMEQLQGHKSELESRVKSRTRQLAKARNRAVSADQAKSQFLANMSHEMRTPLNGILGMTQVTLDSALQPEQHDNISLIQSAAENLLVIVDRILDLTKVESGTVELDLHEFDPREAMIYVERMLRPHTRRKGLELTCEVAQGVPRTVAGDSGRLRQILLNLAGNALKFTDAGTISLYLEPDDSPCQEGEIALRFAVADTGVGLEEDEVGRIFEPFEQASSTIERVSGGTGLGLSIARRLVELMGGRITVESRPGEGSLFAFNLVFDQPAHVPPGGARPTTERRPSLGAAAMSTR